MRSKVSSTLGFSSASMADSDTEFSMSSSSSKFSSGIGASPSPRRRRPAGGLPARQGRALGASASCAPGAVMSIFGVFLPSGPA